jgi:2-oxoglutarate dehydrogenase complex dihydrolipoamide succinyltransferase (E2) component
MSIKVILPQIGQSIAEATIVKWFKKPGDSIEKGEILVEIGTDKVNTEIPAPESGVVEELLVEEGVTVPVQTEIAVIGSGAEASSAGTSESAPRATTDRLSPVVRRLAQEHNVDLSKIQGTGEGGRITKEDVMQAVESKSAKAKAKSVPMSRMRKLIAGHMIQSKQNTAELTTVFEIDMTSVAIQKDNARAIYERDFNLKLTYLPFVIVAVCKGLQQFPVVNSRIDGENMIYTEDCNIGIATAVQDGLVVPVIRNAEKMTVLEAARAAANLAERARTGRLTADDFDQGTFTITNPGVFGALMGTPIINYPQVAILGLGAVEKRAVVIDDAIAIRSMAYFSLTYDHRAMDGAVADAFMACIKKILESECPPALTQ